MVVVWCEGGIDGGRRKSNDLPQNWRPPNNAYVGRRCNAGRRRPARYYNVQQLRRNIKREIYGVWYTVKIKIKRASEREGSIRRSRGCTVVMVLTAPAPERLRIDCRRGWPDAAPPATAPVRPNKKRNRHRRHHCGR